MDSHSTDYGRRPETFSVCRLCLDVFTTSLCPLKYMDIYLVSVLPNLDLTLSKDPGICINCARNLTSSYNFKTRCINNQERILKYYNAFNQSVNLYNLVMETNDGKGNTEKTLEIMPNSVKQSEIGDKDKIEIPHQIQMGCENIPKKVVQSPLNEEERKGNSPVTVIKIELDDDSDIEIVENDIGSYLDNDDGDYADFIEDNDFSTKVQNDPDRPYEACSIDDIKVEAEIDTPAFLDLDKVIFNYTQEVESETGVVQKDLDVDYDPLNESFPEHQEGVELNEYVHSGGKSNKNLLKVGRKKSETSRSDQKLWTRLNIGCFKCLLCMKTFAQKLHLNGHFLSKHNDIPNIDALVTSKIHYCHYCMYRTVNSYNLTLHLMSKHGESRDSKHTLETLFSSPDRQTGVDLDESVHSDGKSNSNLLKVGLTKSEILRSDQQLWTRLSVGCFKCLLCMKKFSQKLHMNGHFLNKHKDIPNIESLITSKIHYCPYCMYRTLNTYNLTSHMMSRHGKSRDSKHTLETLYCFYCNYSTINKGNLVTHSRIHRNSSLLNCNYCKKHFNHRHVLKRHILREHSEELDTK